MIGIYGIMNILTGKLYIGQSVDIKSRLTNHKSKLRNNSHDNDYLQKSWNKYGEKWFRFFPLCECSEDELNKLEDEWITLFDTTNRSCGFNLKTGGDSNCRLSEETKQKISNSHKGLRHSEETKNKISIAKSGENNQNYGKRGKGTPFYGHKHSEESKQKISNSLKGRVVSDETRKKLSESQKGSKSHTWKDYPRIIKKGFSPKGCQIYGIKSDGKVICTSIDLHKLELKLEDMISND